METRNNVAAKTEAGNMQNKRELSLSLSNGKFLGFSETASRTKLLSCGCSILFLGQVFDLWISEVPQFRHHI